MNAEQLLSLANARGIDLKGAAGAAIETKGIGRKRERTEVERELGIDVQETARGRHSRTYRRPEYSLAELAQAAAAGGVKGARWLAVRFSVAGDFGCIDELHDRLSYEAVQIGRRDWWPMQVMCAHGKLEFYRERLARLVLDEDAHRHYFAAAPALFAVCMDVTQPEWDRNLSDPFRSLKAVYEGWLNRALAGIRRGLRGH